MPTFEERFWSKVDASGECWVWTGARCGNRYGNFTLPGGKGTVAHRASWLIHNGPIPDGMLVLHRCDNRPCVNPAHLFLGTYGDNMADMVAKGRQRGGRKRTAPAKQPLYRQVKSVQRNGIVFLYRAGFRQVDLAEMFGLSQTTISSTAQRGYA